MIRPASKVPKKLWHAIRIVLIITLTLIVVTPPTVLHAWTTNDLNTYQTKYPWYNPNDTCGNAAGGGGGPANLTVGKDFSLGPLTDSVGRRVNLMKALMSDYHLTPEQAAGPVGNFMAESGGINLPPDINEGEHVGAPPKFSGGYGWAQWTGPRQVSFINYVTPPSNPAYMASKSEHANDAANYAWLKKELNESQKVTIDAISKTSSPEDSAVAFEAAFERAGNKVLDTRKTNARQVYQEYQGKGTAQGSTGTGGGASTGSGGAGCTGPSSTGTGIVGKYAFPLIGSKKVVLNPGMFRNGTADRGGHPYIAFDILANPGTPVAAFLSGTVTEVTTDKCPGRMISIYNAESDLVVSYLHMDMQGNAALGATVTAGQQVGKVGPPANGCGTPHLHIDVAAGKTRPGCRREDCPAANAAKFRDIGPQLFQTYQVLPNN